MESVVEGLIGNPLVYLLIAGCICGSAVFPPLPSDSMLVTAMGLAAAGELALWSVAAAVLLGGWVGDVLAYSVGRALSRPVRQATPREGRAQAALRWIEAHEDSWGPGLITVSRFIPGGTTAVGISAGVLVYPLRAFLAFAALGACLWTIYGAAVAYVGNALFPGNLWASLTLAVLIALAVGAVAHQVSGSRK